MTAGPLPTEGPSSGGRTGIEPHAPNKTASAVNAINIKPTPAPFQNLSSPTSAPQPAALPSLGALPTTSRVRLSRPRLSGKSRRSGAEATNQQCNPTAALVDSTTDSRDSLGAEAVRLSDVVGPAGTKPRQRLSETKIGVAYSCRNGDELAGGIVWGLPDGPGCFRMSSLSGDGSWSERAVSKSRFEPSLRHPEDQENRRLVLGQDGDSRDPVSRRHCMWHL